VDKVYVSDQSMEQRGLKSEDLLLPAEFISAEDLSRLIDQSNCVFNL